MTDDYLDDPEIVQLFVEYAGIDASELELGMRNMLDALNPAEIPKEKAQIAAERMKLAAQKCALDGKIDRLSELEEGYIQLSSEKGLFEVKKEGLFRKSAAIPEHDKHYFSHLNTIAEYTGAGSGLEQAIESVQELAPENDQSDAKDILLTNRFDCLLEELYRCANRKDNTGACSLSNVRIAEEVAGTIYNTAEQFKEEIELSFEYLERIDEALDEMCANIKGDLRMSKDAKNSVDDMVYKLREKLKTPQYTGATAPQEEAAEEIPEEAPEQVELEITWVNT